MPAGFARGQPEAAVTSLYGAHAARWPQGWCQAAQELQAQSAISLGASVLLGVSAWLLLVFAGFAVFSVVKQRRHLHLLLREAEQPKS